MDRPDQGARDRQPRHGRVRLPDLGRAEAARPHAPALRAEPRRAVRAPPADRRPHEAARQGELLSGRRDRRPLPRRAARSRVHGARRVQRHPVRRHLGDRRLHGDRRRRGRADLADPHLRPRRDGDLRVRRRRLGERVEVLAPRLDADLRAARLLRGLARARGARRRAHVGDALADARSSRPSRRRPGTSARRSSASSASSSPASPRRTAPRSTCPRPSRSSSPATTPSTAGCAGASSRWPSTST